jgi:5-methylcytosine-specific restriction endonuclease McrA
MKVKKCTKCGEEKPATLEYFHRKTHNKDGFRHDCKMCRKSHYEANKEARKVYYEANKEVISKRQKAYHEAKKTVIAERKKTYYRTPKGKFSRIKCKANERGINFSLPFELYEGKLWGKPCHYCGCDIEVTGLDRKDSSKGYTLDNVVSCCWNCNTKKGPKPYEDFLAEIKTNP